MVEKISFVEFDRVFLKKSFCWLSNPEIKYLMDAPVISLNEQELWFQSLPTKKNYYIKGVMANDIPIGAVGIKNITIIEGEYWGYIGEKKYWGQGIGKLMVREMMEIAKNFFFLEVLYLQVMPDNNRAIESYRQCGFVMDNTEGKYLRMAYRFHQ